VTIDLDKTVLLQMVLFALLIVLLKPLLFDPVLKVFALREQRTDGARQTARELQIEAGELLSKYEQEAERISREAAQEREQVRTVTNKLEAEILDEARAVQDQILAQGRQEMDRQARLIRAQLEQESKVLAGKIAHRVLGREVAL
jgi:F-type H+-transporting ATPase subunit b